MNLIRALIRLCYMLKLMIWLEILRIVKMNNVKWISNLKKWILVQLMKKKLKKELKNNSKNFMI